MTDFQICTFRILEVKTVCTKIMGMEHSLTLLKNWQSAIQFQVFLPGFGILIMMGT